MRRITVLLFCFSILVGAIGCIESATSSSASTFSPSGAKITVDSDMGMVTLSQNSTQDTVVKSGSRTLSIGSDQVHLDGGDSCRLPEGVKTIEISLNQEKLTIIADGKTIWEK